MRRLLGLLALLMLLPAGCNRPTNIAYTLERKQQCAAVTIGAVSVLFEAVPSSGPDAQVASGMMMAGGQGASTGQIGANEIMVKYRYANGVLAITVGPHSFDVIERGTVLRFADRTVRADAGERVYVLPDGTTKLNGP